MWDSSETPYLTQSGPDLVIRTPSASQDILLRYVPLRGAYDFSVAFSANELLAISAHTTCGTNSSIYSELSEYAMWTYCPLSEQDLIVGVWTVTHSNENLKVQELIVGGPAYI
jgi:hypothetical protein